LSGLFVAAIYVTLFDNLVAVTPDEDRTSYIAVFNMAGNVALVIGPLIAGLLARQPNGLTLGLQLTAAAAFAAGIMFALRRPR
jgi:MFS family permease